MSNSWWTWVREQEHQKFLVDIVILKDKVECLESENVALNRKFDWLYNRVKKMDSLASKMGDDGVKPTTSD